jgi:hypothetical protein
MSSNANSTNPSLVNQQQVTFDTILGTNSLPAPIPEQKSLTVDDIDEKIHQLKQQAPGYNFKDRWTIRNRYNRTSISRATIERRLRTAMLLELQEYDREFAVRLIDEQLLDLYAQRYRIQMADRRKRYRYSEECITGEGSTHRRLRRRIVEEEEEEEVDNCPVCQSTLAEGAVTHLPCSHSLHADCYVQLLARSQDQRCPTCRTCMTCAGDCDACSECHLHGQHTGSCSIGYAVSPLATRLSNAVAGLQT